MKLWMRLERNMTGSIQRGRRLGMIQNLDGRLNGKPEKSKERKMKRRGVRLKRKDFQT